jgi:GalNAc-alpha-(1->4)-GalNAc-alpha-(1->3)-diNAcBac-PP-undecaprenol alpha-1,4-N-acetyl-D-galactosaminyltransferase
MRLTLVIPSLEAGGAERVLSILADAWAQDGHNVALVTMAPAARDFFPLDQRIERVSIGLDARAASPWAFIAGNLRRVRRLRAAIRDSRPDAVVSFIIHTNVITLLACRGLAVPVIVSERTTPRWPFGPLLSAMRRFSYPLADALVVQTSEGRAWARRFLRPERVFVIPNPVLPPTDLAADVSSTLPPADVKPTKSVIAVGRLVRVKGYDLLIDAFARCADRRRDWDLVILGEGQDRQRLEALALRLGVSARVSLPGSVKDTASAFRSADIFALSSRMEGFPNALLEAMACGLPSVAFDCSSGPRDIIRHSVDGLLVPPESAGALAEALDRLMADDDLRLRLARRAPEVLERFSIGSVMAQWRAVLDRVAAAGN